MAKDTSNLGVKVLNVATTSTVAAVKWYAVVHAAITIATTISSINPLKEIALLTLGH